MQTSALWLILTVIKFYLRAKERRKNCRNKAILVKKKLKIRLQCNAAAIHNSEFKHSQDTKH